MKSKSEFILASAQYDIGFLNDWPTYVSKINHWVKSAADKDAQLLLFPEYFSMELASLFPKEIYSSLSLQLEALQSLHEEFIKLFAKLSKKKKIHILSGSYPVIQEDKSYRNRAYLFGPDGLCGYQDKLQMTRFETEQWLIKEGDEIKLFDTPLGKIGVNICYDCEFPLIARRQVELGAHLILVPSCTDTLAGHNRVRIGCQARALENQCYVAQSVLVGKAAWSEAVDINHGAAAVYTPVDYGYPNDGILSKGKMDKTQWVYAEIDLNDLAQVRNHGQTFNYRDWPGQFRYL